MRGEEDMFGLGEGFAGGVAGGVAAETGTCGEAGAGEEDGEGRAGGGEAVPPPLPLATAGFGSSEDSNSSESDDSCRSGDFFPPCEVEDGAEGEECFFRGEGVPFPRRGDKAGFDAEEFNDPWELSPKEALP